MNEDILVQQTTADYFCNNLKWDSVYAYNDETFGPDSLLGRESDQEVVLVRDLREAITRLNDNLPEVAVEQAIDILTEIKSSQSIIDANREMYQLIRDGVPVKFRNENGEEISDRVKVIDFEDTTRNRFLIVREMWVQGEVYRRRPDIIGFVNGLPLLFIECKNVHKNLRDAYEQNYKDYRDVIPHIFTHNAVIMLANGIDAKIGSISSEYGHFYDWKRLAEEERGVVDMETLLKGVCSRVNFLDIFENFTMFDTSLGKLIKILARNHQFLGVNRTLDQVVHKDEHQGKLGVFWHTQGSGKSYSMVFLTKKIHRKLGANYTFLICTDREDLDKQIYNTFAGCGLVNNDIDQCRPASGRELITMLEEHKKYVFTLVQKFNQEIPAGTSITERNDIIVITDEAHRSQYGQFALNMRNAMPKASFLGFTGTPLFTNDEITKQVFGEYVSTYDFKRAIEDNATVPLFFDARGERLSVVTDDINEKMAEALDEFDISDVDMQQRLERDLQREYHILTAEQRLQTVARDFVDHYSTNWETGKAMFVCIDKITAVRMYDMAKKLWAEKIDSLLHELERLTGADLVDPDEIEYRQRQLVWMKETQMAVVISEEQNEVARFRNWNIDIVPHRQLLKKGFVQSDGKSLDVESAFKKDEHPFRVAFVCAMWLTGFDVPSLATLYLDKPLKAHTLMQAIARANRVKEGKNNGLIVDYIGILKNLRQALATYAGTQDGGHGGGGIDVDPGKSAEELLVELKESIGGVKTFFGETEAVFSDIHNKTGFERNGAIAVCKNVVNLNDTTRKHFEIMARDVFKKFKSCLTLQGVHEYRNDYKAINLIYKSLENDRERADISAIIQRLHLVADQSVEVTLNKDNKERIFDISKIDFDRLRKEFEAQPHKNTVVQDLKTAIEQRLHILMSRNPMRADYQKRYEEIVKEYNEEQDSSNIERTFNALTEYVRSLNHEETRATREGVDEETLTVLDLLVKKQMSEDDVIKIKKVADGLLEHVKNRIREYHNWKEQEGSRDSIKQTIRDYLYADATGLPITNYSEGDVVKLADDVYKHVYRVYPSIPSPFYQSFSKSH